MTDRTFTIVFSLRETLASLGLKIKEFSPESFDIAISKNEVLEIMKEHDLLVDTQPDEPTQTYGDYSHYSYDEDAYYEVMTAMSDAWQHGTEKNYRRSVESVVEECLSVFANYGDVEYPCEGDSGVRHVVKKNIKGIDKYNVDMAEDKVHITFDRDMVHVLNDLIACDGMFGISCEDAEHLDSGAELSEVESNVKGHFHHLDTYWECYGDRRPEISYEADFDRKYFDEQMREIASRYSKQEQ
jgi:hypothetical protein